MYKRGNKMLKNVFAPEMLPIREVQLMRALSSCAGVYYDINVTQNAIIGTPVQVIDDVEYSVLEAAGLSEDCLYTEFIEYWGKQLEPDEQEDFNSFFSVENLLKCYGEGERSLIYTYWTKDVLGNPMLAEQSILLYEDSTTKDVLGLTYVKDMKTMQELRDKQAESKRKLQQALEKAEKASQAKSTFLFNMSHDIRTPMNIIMGFTDIIEKNASDEAVVRDAVGKLKSSSEILMRLLNDVLDLARIESGKVELDVMAYNLRSFAKKINNIFEEGMRRSGVEFITECDIVDECLMYDSLKLTEIVVNLLGNAQKFTPAGGKVVFKITQLGRAVNGRADYEFRVIDTGIGMSEDFQKTAFNEFERERTSTDSGLKGTGLGLAIVKKLIDLMKGEIHIISELGKGSEMVFTLSFQLQDKAERESENIALEELGDFSGKRVLLVEDNVLNREIASGILLDEGFVVEEAENGMIAVDKVIHSKPGYYDLILMDIQMPIMDGYTATREIRGQEDKQLSQIPIIAMTANAFADDQQKCLKAGMNGHIGKPIMAKKMIETVSRVLEQVEELSI